jgi:hypothetical protein
VVPVHVATAGEARVDVEVTTMSKTGRIVTKRTGLDPKKTPRPLVIQTP